MKAYCQKHYCMFDQAIGCLDCAASSANNQPDTQQKEDEEEYSEGYGYIHTWDFRD